MSIDATRWAWQQQCERATDKFILVSMADRADENHYCYPSIARLSSDTQLNRKTVMAGISRLEKSGLISANRTDGRHTKYTLIGVESRHNQSNKKRTKTSPKNGTGTKTGTSPKNGTAPVPKTVPHQSQKRDTNLSRTYQEPPTGYIRKKNNVQIPHEIDKKLWDEWMDVRKRKKAVNSPTAIKALLNRLDKCEAAGHAKNKSITIAIEHSWKSVMPEWIDNLNRSENNETRQRDNRSTAQKVTDRLDEIARKDIEENGFVEWF